MNYLDLLRFGAPEAIMVVTTLLVLSIGLTRTRPTFAAITGIIGVLAAAVAVCLIPQHASIAAGMLVLSPLNSLLKLVCLSITILTLLLAAAERLLNHRAEFAGMVLLASLGLMLLIGAEELLMIFIGLELLGLSLYVMTAFDSSDHRGVEAGTKYFLFGSTASAFTLFGISLVYGTAGSTTLGDIGHTLSGAPASPLLIVAVAMTLIGFAFKIAAAPFHLWAPDAYEAAPVPASAFISSGSKIASFLVLGKILLVAFAGSKGTSAWHAVVAGWSPLLAILAALSILIGNFVALAQTNVRRLLAYSAVAHAGYTLIGLTTGSREGFAATLFYISVYAFTLVGAFAVCGVVRRATGGNELKHFAALSHTSPIASGAMAVFMLSLAGLPPLPGFFGKFYLFSGAFRATPVNGLGWLIAVALFGSLVSLYYYLVVLRAIFRSSSDVEAAPTATIGWDPANIVAAVAALAVIVTGFAPQLLVERLTAALR